MERFINILVIDSDAKILHGLKEILSGSGNNVLLANSMEEALDLIERKEIGILFINIDESIDGLSNIQQLRKNSLIKNNYIILITKEGSSNVRLVKGMREGAVDYITHPFNPNLIKSKVEVFKSLYYKDQRIGQLLSNIFPLKVLEELSSTGKFSPKRVENGVVLFTDFVDFSVKAKTVKPLTLIRQLEKHFTRFDEIIDKYNLEKIKTIGDAYMALSGVTEDNPEPAIRSCLAALEIRDYMRKERDIAIAMKRDFWEIRIGLHMGPLVAGIIGASKYSFDVWGDTVNIAARAEAMTKSSSISITETIYEKINGYFEVESRGSIDIQKRGGTVEMFYLEQLKEEFCMYNEGLSPNTELRVKCGLPSMDFEHMRMNILNRLRSLLPDDILYHDVPHTLNVEKAAIRYGKLEGVNDADMLILRTAALYHDAGFILQYNHNEDFGIGMARSSLPKFGYSEDQIDAICKIINATKMEVIPETLLEKIMKDADYDYLGRPDYHVIVKKLRKEMESFGTTFSDEEWILFQLDFLQNQHMYHTETAQNIRAYGKSMRIEDLKKKLQKNKREPGSMKVYTKKGDTGTTQLIGGTRIPKSSLRIEAYGTTDELNSWIGLIRDQDIAPKYIDQLLEIQDRLFTLGALLATDPGKSKMELPELHEKDTTYLEECIDEMDKELEPMKSFVLPGGHTTVSYTHVARCVCRRSERIITELSTEGEVAPIALAYVNRLSDYLFVLGRKLTKDLNAKEQPWKPRM